MMSQQSDGIDRPDEEAPPAQKIPFWKVVFSVMSAGFGVQNRKNRERDFTNGSVTGFVVAGLLFVAAFILVLVSIVTVVT